MRRSVFLAALLLVVAACEAGPPSSSPPATGQPTGTSAPAVGVLGRPEVEPIEAMFDQSLFKTSYRSQIVTIGQESRFTYRWSGPNCGTWGPMGDQVEAMTEGAGILMTWVHAHPPCAATTNHSDVLVTLTVSNSKGTTVCVYQGSESGRGPTCQPL